MLVAHPLTQPFALPVSPLVVAGVGAVAVSLVALAWPERPGRAPAPTRPCASWQGSLSGPQTIGRGVSVTLLVLAIAAGRAGVADQLENLAPALVVGAAWPLLVLASTLIGPVWRWLDPWDGLARVLSRGSEEQGGRELSRAPEEQEGRALPRGAGEQGGREHVWPAAVLALPWVWYLSAYADPLAPRAVGAALAVYSLVTVAGCLAMGRVRWLASAEPLGIALSWMALLPGRRLGEWRPPRGAEALIGVLGGGVLFGALKRSELWGDLNAIPAALAYSSVGVVVSCALVAGLLLGMASPPAPSSERPGVARAAVPAVAGIIVAVAMDSNRLFTSVQLLPGLLGDPFGLGWDLLGSPVERLDPAPLGTTGLLVAQLAVLLSSHLAGAIVLARRTARREREPAIAALAITFVLAVMALLTH